MEFTVQVVGARGLLIADRKSSDPFVVVQAGHAVGKTDVVKKNLDPTFDPSSSTFTFSLPSSLLSSGAAHVSFHVLDWDRVGSADPLGTVYLPVEGEISAQQHGFSLTSLAEQNEPTWIPISPPPANASASASASGSGAGDLCVHVSALTALEETAKSTLPPNPFSVWLDSGNLLLPDPGPGEVFIETLAGLAPRWSAYEGVEPAQVSILGGNYTSIALEKKSGSKLKGKLSVQVFAGIVDLVRDLAGATPSIPLSSGISNDAFGVAFASPEGEKPSHRRGPAVGVFLDSGSVTVSSSLSLYGPELVQNVFDGLVGEGAVVGKKNGGDGFVVHKDGMFHGKFKNTDAGIHWSAAVANVLSSLGFVLASTLGVSGLLFVPHEEEWHGPPNGVVMGIQGSGHNLAVSGNMTERIASWMTKAVAAHVAFKKPFKPESKSGPSPLVAKLGSLPKVQYQKGQQTTPLTKDAYGGAISEITASVIQMLTSMGVRALFVYTRVSLLRVLFILPDVLPTPPLPTVRDVVSITRTIHLVQASQSAASYPDFVDTSFAAIRAAGYAGSNRGLRMGIEAADGFASVASTAAWVDLFLPAYAAPPIELVAQSGICFSHSVKQRGNVTPTSTKYNEITVYARVLAPPSDTPMVQPPPTHRMMNNTMVPNEEGGGEDVYLNASAGAGPSAGAGASSDAGASAGASADVGGGVDETPGDDEVDEAPLPPGWVETVGPDGTKMFLFTPTNQVSMTRPS